MAKQQFEAIGERETVRGAAAALFGATILSSACLLFLVQPLASKLILPVFGGSSSIWITCLLFFQTGLLLGYLYSHVLISRVNAKWHSRAHMAALIVSLAALPILPNPRWHPAAGHDPVWSIFGLLATSVGLPYLMLSTTSPLLQSWFARARGGELPYHYFAISNLGSLVALFSFPLVIEPNFTRHQQVVGWSLAYAVFVALCVTVAWQTRGSDARVEDRREVARSSFTDLAFWTVLPACASMMLMVTTSIITENLAPMPLVWILPLGVYLLSFILCFARRNYYWRPVYLPLLIAAMGAVAACIGPLRHEQIYLSIPLLCAALFVSCMVMHGEVARQKPEPERLTTFYLCLSAGGAIGGALVGLVAPRVFNAMHEFVIVLAVVPAVAFVAVLRRRTGWRHPRVVYALSTVGLLAANGVAIYGWQQFWDDIRDSKVVARNFYGSVQVYSASDTDFPAFVLSHGVTIHGLQFVAWNLRNQPTAYYSRHSGAGLTYKVVSAAGPVKMGVIGLGTGTMAAYGRAGDQIRFYEIDPKVLKIAKTEFSFLADSKAKVDVVEGDARLMLAEEPSQQFDILAVDAFSSDAIPTHLLTREAFQLYWRHLKPDGVLAMHVSNHYLDLGPVVQLGNQGLGKDIWQVICTKDEPGDTEPYNSTYILVSSRKDFFTSKDFDQRLSIIAVPTKLKMWTDEYTTLWPIFRIKGDL
jgi:SAM-dependent methyltransferase